MIFKKIFLIIFVFLLIPFASLAQEDFSIKKDHIFKAKILDIIAEDKKINENNQEILQQNIKLIGLDSSFENKIFIFHGIGDIELIGQKIFKKGDKVLVNASFDDSKNDYNYYIIDYIRSSSLFFVFLVFLLSVILVGGFKGFRSIFSLFLTFLIILYFIIPQIMAGLNPVMIVLVGSIFILFFVIYITEGFNLKSHLALFSTIISLFLVVFISWFFVYLTKLTGAFNEDVFVLINIGQQAVNLKGMLLAGMIIGAIGVLDDVIISQVVSVEQIIEANPYQNWKEVFKKSYKIGVSHISSMTNTLFLAYAGASLPLLMLFVSPENPFNNLEQIINNEAISTEIVRALSGSIGLILSVPISTLIASWIFVYKKRKNNI